MAGGSQAGRAAGQATVRAARSRAGRALARGGFVAVGILHLVVAYLALRIALGFGQERADRSGAVGTVAAAPGGPLALWFGAACCAALALWWLSEAILSARRPGDGTWDVLRAAGKAAVFLAVGGLFASYALGARSDSRAKSQELTATVMAAPGGQWLVLVAGAALVVIGGYYAWRGASRRFVDQEVRAKEPARPVTAVGVVGYAAKGAALGIVGVLVVVAAARNDPSQSTGLDGALKGLAAQPYGTWLLAAVALGLACFGLYSIARAKYGEV